MEALLDPEANRPENSEEVGLGSNFNNPFSAKPVINIAENIMRFNDDNLTVRSLNSDRVDCQQLAYAIHQNAGKDV